MKITNLHIAMVALLMAGCSEVEIDNGQQQKGLMPVLFSAGNTDVALTRGESAAYMPENSRFVCSMFFHAGANDNNDSKYYLEDGTPTSDVNMTTAWLKINNTTGNAVYWNKSFGAAEKTDVYGFDEAAKCFYWQNRLNHIFLAVADYNKLSSDDGNTGSLKLFPDIQTKKPTKDGAEGYMLEYNITTGGNMSAQPDPIQAVVKMKPEGATPEANRVKLFFKHQFSQFQINLKSSQDKSANVNADQIISVELLGVSSKGYVAYCIDANGNVPESYGGTANVDDSFALFPSGSVPTGYLKSFEGIAFGTLHGIRITWKEAGTNGITHEATYKALEGDYKNLKSGRKYIYNFELRRSLIAQISAEITDWEVDKNNYTAKGTIDNSVQN